MAITKGSKWPAGPQIAEETRVQITNTLLLFSLRMAAIICLDAVRSPAILLGICVSNIQVGISISINLVHQDFEGSEFDSIFT